MCKKENLKDAISDWILVGSHSLDTVHVLVVLARSEWYLDHGNPAQRQDVVVDTLDWYGAFLPRLLAIRRANPRQGVAKTLMPGIGRT